MLLIESDERFGKPDFAKERGATLQKARNGESLLTPSQLNWLFDEVVGIPVRREAHELSAMLEEIETHGRHVLTGEAGKAKYPPAELCGTHPVEAKEDTDQASAHVGAVDEASNSGSGAGQEQRLQHDVTFATAAGAPH